MSIQRITLAVFFILLVLSIGCKKECEDICLFDEDIRYDTTAIITVDTTWIVGADSVVLIYKNQSGASKEFELAQYETTYSTRSFITNCGECGDSIKVFESTPTFRYSIKSVDDIQIDLRLRSNVFLTDTNRLYKCVVANLSMERNDVECSTEFLAGCNVNFSPEEEWRFQSQRYNQQRVDTFSQNFCAPDSGLMIKNCFGQEVEFFHFGKGAPIYRFKVDSDCWTYDTIMVR